MSRYHYAHGHRLPRPPGHERTYTFAQLAKLIATHESVARVLLCRAGIFASNYEAQKREDIAHSEFPKLMVDPTPEAIANGWVKKGTSLLTEAGLSRLMDHLRGRTST